MGFQMAGRPPAGAPGSESGGRRGWWGPTRAVAAQAVLPRAAAASAGAEPARMARPGPARLGRPSQWATVTVGHKSSSSQHELAAGPGTVTSGRLVDISGTGRKHLNLT